MIFMQLTNDQRQEVRQVSRQALGRVALRAHMVLLSDHSFSVPQIAEIHDCGEDVVRTWLHRYQEQGIAGLEDEPRSDGPPHRRCPGQSVAGVLGPRPELLDGPPADCVLGQSLPPVPLAGDGASVAPSDGVALGASPFGSRQHAPVQAGSRCHNQTGRHR